MTKTAEDRAYKRPESVLVVVHNRAGEVLLLRRRHPPWFWQSVTGSLGWDETPRQAARRELFEETGLRPGDRLTDCGHSVVFPIVPPWRARYAPAARYNREHWFALALEGRRTINLSASEHSQYRWMPVMEARRRVTSWTNRQAIDHLLAGLCARS